jgi:hypothetical protein
LVIFGFAIFGPNPAETDRCPALLNPLLAEL